MNVCRTKINQVFKLIKTLQGLIVPTLLIPQQKAIFYFIGMQNTLLLIMKLSFTNVMLVNITTNLQMISRSTIIHSPAFLITSSVIQTGPHVLTVSVLLLNLKPSCMKFFEFLDTTCPNPKDLSSNEIEIVETSITYNGRVNFTENIWYLLILISYSFCMLF